MQDVTMLVEAAAGGEAAEHIDVRWQPDMIAMSAEARAHVEARWAEYAAAAAGRGHSLFNGEITRLISAGRENGRVQLVLGAGDYKTFLVTCLRDRPWFLAHAPEAMTLALGNSVLLTHGDEAFLGIRSPRVSAYAGRAHVVGGVLDRLGEGGLEPSVAGMIEHLKIELSEEVGVTADELIAGPRFLGVGRDEFLGQPDAMWRWETGLEMRELAGRLNLDEHSGMVIVRRGVMDDAMWQRMTPVARHCWRAWSHG